MTDYIASSPRGSNHIACCLFLACALVWASAIALCIFKGGA